MGDPELRSRIDENVRSVLGGGDARAMAMARMTTGTDDGEGERWRGAKLFAKAGLGEGVNKSKC